MATAQQLKRRQLSMENMETIDWILYDSLYMTASATQTLTFFQNTVGSVGRSRTNMKNAGSLPDPQTFFVEEIGVKLYNDDGTAFVLSKPATEVIYPPNIIFANMFFDFVVDPNVVFEGHGMQFREQQDAVNDGAATTLTQGALQTAMNLRVMKLKKPIMILPQRSFSVQMTVTTGAAAGGFVAAHTRLSVWLKGQKNRNA